MESPGQQVEELQEEGTRLCRFREGKLEIEYYWRHRSKKSRCPAALTSKVSKASTANRQHRGEGGTKVSGNLWQLGITCLPFLPCTKVLAALEANEQDPQGETTPAAHTKDCNRMRQVLRADISLLRGTPNQNEYFSFP